MTLHHLDEALPLHDATGTALIGSILLTGPPGCDAVRFRGATVHHQGTKAWVVSLPGEAPRTCAAREAVVTLDRWLASEKAATPRIERRRTPGTAKLF